MAEAPMNQGLPTGMPSKQQLAMNTAQNIVGALKLQNYMQSVQNDAIAAGSGALTDPNGGQSDNPFAPYSSATPKDKAPAPYAGLRNIGQAGPQGGMLSLLNSVGGNPSQVGDGVFHFDGSEPHYQAAALPPAFSGIQDMSASSLGQDLGQSGGGLGLLSLLPGL